MKPHSQSSLVYGTKSGKFILKSKKIIKISRTREMKLTDYNLKKIDLNLFPAVNDFEIIVTEHKDPHLGRHLYYYSNEFGVLTSFPWWDFVGEDLQTKKIHDIMPIGTLCNPYDNLEQGWQLLIWEKGQFIYIMQGNEPCCTEFDIWYKVNKNDYYVGWNDILSYYK